MKNMRIITISAALVVFCLLSGCRDEQTVTVTDDPKMVLDSLERKLAWVDLRIGQERWRQQTGLAPDSLEFFTLLRDDLLSDSRTYSILRDARARLTDELDQRRLELILPELVRENVDAQDITADLSDSLKDFFGTEWCRVDGRVTSLADAEKAVTYGRRSEREAAYRGLTSPGEAVANQVARLIRLRNQVARRFGYNDYLSLLARANQVDLDEYIRSLEQIDSLTRPAYRSLMGELRRSYSETEFQVWDFANMFAKTLGEADVFFPVDSQLAYALRTFEGFGFDLDNSPIYLHLSDQPFETADLNLIRVQVPYDVRLTGRLANGSSSYCRLMASLSQGVHAVAVEPNDYLLASGWNDAWSYCTSSIFRRLCLSTPWLRGYAGMSTGMVDRYQRACEALDLLKIRLALVDALFEYQAYRSAPGDLNELYWDTFERMTDLPEHTDLQPWAGNAAIVLNPLASYKQLAGRAAGAQTWAYLKEHYSSSEPSEVGAFLRHNYFRFGARYEWTELLERATGQPFSITHITNPL